MRHWKCLASVKPSWADGSQRNSKKRKESNARWARRFNLNRLSVVCFLFFKGVTSTNIVGGVPLLRAHRVLRANLFSLHRPSDKAILNGLIRAGYENPQKSSHGDHGGLRPIVHCSPFGGLEFGVRGSEFEAPGYDRFRAHRTRLSSSS